MKAKYFGTIEVTRKSPPLVFRVVQGDTGREIELTIADLAVPDDAVASVYVETPGGTVCYDSAEISNDSGISTIAIQLTKNMLAYCGICKTQIHILSGDDTVTSFDFYVDVSQSRIDTETIQGSNEFTALENAIRRVENITLPVVLTLEDYYALVDAGAVEKDRIYMITQEDG